VERSVLNVTFKDIADAIRDKDGTTRPIVANTFADRIRAIPTGEGPVYRPTIVWLYIDPTKGTGEYEALEQTINVGDTITPPSIVGNVPAGDFHPELEFQGWNHDNDEFMNVQESLVIGAVYKPTNGRTFLHVRLTSLTGTSATDALSQAVWLRRDAGTHTTSINWGDGTPTEDITTAGNVTIPHTYPALGDYNIEIWTSSGTGGFGGTSLMNTTIVGQGTVSKQSILIKFYSGNDWRQDLGGYPFNGCNQLTTLTFREGTRLNYGSGDASFGNNLNALFCLVAPKTTLTNSTVSSNRAGIVYLSFNPKGSINRIYLFSVPNLKRMTFTRTPVSYRPSYLDMVVLREMIIHGNVTELQLSGVFQSLYMKQNPIQTQLYLSSMSIPADFTVPSTVTDLTLSNVTMDDIAIPPNITSINLINTNLKSFVAREGLTAINLNSNKEMREVTISSTIASLVNAFGVMSRLERMIINRATPPTAPATLALTNVSSALKIYVPDANLNDYKTATNWVNHADRIFPMSDIGL
jgi:hypothetical protein